ncbi:molybdenum cofactor guanylyltransferase [Costertonia aggregata]|uniref:Probable molybdenum cofactor guanylyltransferase n=1 Tax=Costertonia aggregata TaxID=343403 RepID=A0A7H9AMN6_9FLAO|nr:molybdenum cofactor guanylyltransferase [Costertonia aggregata]QLG44633.1 molybdenum cofactor guanylyltransferase [Costertonia aggregata]
MQIKKEHITGILLAGGKSSRMGTDKGLLNFQGKPFVQHIIDTLKPFVNTIIIVSDNKGHDIFGVTRIPDIIKDSGPLAGLYSGLAYSKTDYNLVLSCDVPLLNQDVLHTLLSHISKEHDVIQLQSEKLIMPLIAVYRKSCRKYCHTLLQQGEKRLRSLTSGLPTKTVVLKKEQEFFAKNINTKTQLKEILNAVDH